MYKTEKIVAVVEARMTSTRLPGKVLLPVNGEPILKYLINRLKRLKSIDDIVLATTVNATDDILCEFATTNNISFFRGSENDVMGRVLGASQSVNADIIVEITGDCPIIDPSIVDLCLQSFLNNEVDYLSNVHVRSYPDGMDTQVFRTKTLEKSYHLTSNEEEREHVTLHIRRNPNIFSFINVVAPYNLHWPELGLTLDELKDFQFLSEIITHFGSENQYFGCEQVITFLQNNTKLLTINDKVQRKLFY